jgi:hypothetical protein
MSLGCFLLHLRTVHQRCHKKDPETVAKSYHSLSSIDVKIEPIETVVSLTAFLKNIGSASCLHPSRFVVNGPQCER